MSMTLYFAKLNLVSDDIFELYDDPKQRKAIAYALYEAIKANKYLLISTAEMHQYKNQRNLLYLQ